jgi:hypothetical protein
MRKKLLIIFSGLAVLLALELSGIKTAYIDEIQQYLKVVIATFLASDSTSDILKTIRGLLEAKNALNRK